MLEAIILVVFPFAMAQAAMSDMLSMTIANRVSLVLVGAFALVAPFTGMPLMMIGSHVAALALVLVVCFGLFALGVMGGGDAKLMASTALWFGLNIGLAQYLLLASALGGVLTLAILNYRRSSMNVIGGRLAFLRRIGDPKEKIPYGIALGTAGLLLYPEAPLTQWAIGRLAGF